MISLEENIKNIWRLYVALRAERNLIAVREELIC
jgi:hypothetical protein